MSTSLLKDVVFLVEGGFYVSSVRRLFTIFYYYYFFFFFFTFMVLSGWGYSSCGRIFKRKRDSCNRGCLFFFVHVLLCGYRLFAPFYIVVSSVSMPLSAFVARASAVVFIARGNHVVRARKPCRRTMDRAFRASVARVMFSWLLICHVPSIWLQMVSLSEKK